MAIAGGAGKDTVKVEVVKGVGASAGNPSSHLLKLRFFGTSDCHNGKRR
jgi:hypothetical protein